ncbi:MAG: hypothetical protein GFH27_549321n141 [Chloroflexi bacterium AL-W]|nr:hypothetical protein [Chloroflexi bacterium AL-N1]NOK65018.1 hypothetical protein [Chloroflexi bacterium AL-N10]NOK76788.1 hypothetical protein [Chloroflexi bacterium AL-N5]NOK84680.1 hypothetical protein [Chloroflexi bacterium AL-W]NOK86495.1 hypothetical protein [Chloroflexi bacterium AL-N15]
MSNWFQRFSDAVYKEYDRRIKQASLVTEYGESHHHDEDEHDEEEDGAVEIANVRPGTVVRQPEEEEDAAEIANVPRGAVVDDEPASDEAAAQRT